MLLCRHSRIEGGNIMALNQDAFDIAREILEEKVNIPTYYKNEISEETNLEAQTLVPCPLHDESTASFKYFNDTESFYCFGCERGGSIIELHYHLMRRSHSGYTKSRAVIDLARDYDIKIPNIFDESYVDEKKAFKPKTLKISQDKTYPIAWLQTEIEKELKRIKRTDINAYIEYCSQVDNIQLLGHNVEHKLKHVLENIYEEGV